MGDLTRTRLSARSSFRAATANGMNLGPAVWLLPILIIAVIYFSPKHVISAGTAFTLLLAGGLVVIATSWPDRSLIILVVLLPFEGLLLAWLYRSGVPSSVVRHMSAVKEALALGVVLAGVRNFIAQGRRADALDRLALGFVALVGLYLAVQTTIIPSAPSSTSVRFLGFRQDAGFVLLLLGARHANLGTDFLDRVGRVALVIAAVVAGIGIFEALDSSGWNHFVVNTVQYTRYEVAVLHTQPLNFYDIRIYGTIGGTQIVRIGSVFLSALNLGFYLVLGFAIGLERFARGRGRPWVMISLLVIIPALVLTQTRSAILAALIVAFLATRPMAKDRSHWRIQLAIVLAAAAVIALPTAVASGLGARVVASTSNPDNAGHLSAFSTGINTIAHHPTGLGLGTSAGVGQRFQGVGSQAVIAENSYLQFGVELGLLGMLLFIALTVAAIRTIHIGARRSLHYLPAATGAALAGLAVGAWFLQTWTDFSTAWSVWGLAGAALGSASLRKAANAQPIAASHRRQTRERAAVV